MRYRECGEVLNGGWFALKTNGKLYQICVISIMLYGSETRWLREREVELLRTARTMMRAKRGVKLIYQKNTKEIIQMLGVTGPIEKMVKAAVAKWYGQALQREEG